METTTLSENSGRRPLSTRNVRVFQRLAAWLARAGISPNAISAASIVFGCGAGLAFALTSGAEGLAQRGLWLLGAACIQFRLLANMLDGMVAVEGKRGGPTGELWNEAPDRVSDVATLLGAGYAAGSSPELGWAAAAAALFVAYTRALGASAGVGQVFTGPMAKPQRMFWLTLVSLFAALAPLEWSSAHGLMSRVVMILVLIGAGIDFKSRPPKGTGTVVAMQVAIVSISAVLAVLRYGESLAHEWSFPVMPAALLAITFGGIYTSFLRLSEIARKLRAMKATTS